jgi:hypothetical protein
MGNWEGGFDRRERKGHHLFPGIRTFYSSSSELEQVDFHHPILERAGSVNRNYADRNLYVVELNPKVFDWERRFFEAICTGFPGDSASMSE